MLFLNSLHKCPESCARIASIFDFRCDKPLPGHNASWRDGQDINLVAFVPRMFVPTEFLDGRVACAAKRLAGFLPI
jgi:hypothetical protein